MAPGWWPPDGSVTQAYGLCFDPCGRIVLVQLDDGFWTLPGGNVEPDETPLDETPLDTLLREVAEVRPWRPRHETVARTLVTPAQFTSSLSWTRTRIAARLLDLAISAEDQGRGLGRVGRGETA
jgi:ADP-ribose pyrophosphatase YjhB (NUDIX family)